MTSATDLPVRPKNAAVIFIAASAERVWNALTDPADQATYFGGKTEIGQRGERWIRHTADNGKTRTTINEYHARDWGDDYGHAAAQGWTELLSGLKTLAKPAPPLPPLFQEEAEFPFRTSAPSPTPTAYP